MSPSGFDRLSASVIIPVHNGAATLGACLCSVLKQHDVDFELIVVDDASTDATPEIIASFADSDPRLRPLRLPRSVGPAAARNAGARAARGALFAFVDADCTVEPAWLSRHLHAQERAEIVGGAIVGAHLTAWGRADGYCSWFDSIPVAGGAAARARHLPTANLSVARAVFERIGLFREGERLYSEDAELCERALRQGEEIIFDPAIVVRHRDRDSLGDYLRHQWTAGIQLLSYRREPGARYHWLMPRGRVSGVLLALPLAAAYTAYIASKWLPHDPRVLTHVPLIFAGKLAQTIAMAVHAGIPSKTQPTPPALVPMPRP